MLGKGNFDGDEKEDIIGMFLVKNLKIRFLINCKELNLYKIVRSIFCGI